MVLRRVQLREQPTRQSSRQLLCRSRRPKNARNRARRIGRLEPLEDRNLLATFHVTTTLDSGSGTLRQAILSANARPGPDRIDFDFSAPTATAPVEAAQANVIAIDFGGLQLAGSLDIDTDGEATEDDNQVAPAGRVAVIRPVTLLPIITDTLEIDALEHEGFGLLTTPTQSVEIRGDLIQGGSAALRIEASDSNIRGLVINSFTVGMILRNGASRNFIASNLFGVRIDGSESALADGIHILGSADNKILDNVFVGTKTGIYLKDGATGNVVQGNRISGGSQGIWLDGSSLNSVGGTTAGAGNVISGTDRAGIWIAKSAAFPSNGNTVQANRLVGNDSGILMEDAFANVVGGDESRALNYFRTNETGLQIVRGGNNHVIKNRFGTNDAGTSTQDLAHNELGNAFGGIQVQDSTGNKLRGNQIAGMNPQRGRASAVPAAIKIEGTASSDNEIVANLIGTDSNGDKPLTNYAVGIAIGNAPNTLITNNTIAASTVISPGLVEKIGEYSLAHGIAGILVQGDQAENTIIQRNLIGTDSSGTKGLGNDGLGILVVAPNTLIGGSNGEGNTISATRGAGIGIISPGRATILGNFIGTNSTGTKSLGNTLMGILAGSSDNVIGGTGNGDGNVLSGNHLGGLGILRSENNTVQGNRIGVDKTGTTLIGNGEFGVLIGNAGVNRIGGTQPGSQNIIGGNKKGGILLVDSNQVQIAGNRIGVGAAGIAVGNKGPGIKIQGGRGTLIGGATAAAQNWIADNHGPGIFIEASEESRIEGNRIGDVGHGNWSSGIYSAGGFDSEIIGNEISNQKLNGIHLFSGESTLVFNNTIEGNLAAGVLLDDTDLAQIGSNARGGNLIRDNRDGVRMIHQAAENQLQNNRISENRNTGVIIDDATDNVIGGIAVSDGNKIFLNRGEGIYVRRGTGNRLESNSIYDNRDLGIDLRHGKGTGITTNDDLDSDPGANGLQNFPTIDSVTVENLATTVTGTLRSAPNTAFRLQFFANDLPETSGYGEGKTLLGSLDGTTDANGELAFQKSFTNSVVNPGQTVTAVAIASNGDTSEFSPFFRMPTVEQQANQLAQGQQYAPKVATDSRGNFVVVWQGERPGEPSKFTVLYRRFRNDGTPLDETDRQAPSQNSQFGPSNFDVAMDDTGNFVIVWRDDLTGDLEGGIYGRRFDAAGNPRDAQQFHINTITEQEQKNPVVAMDEDGDFVVAWQSGSYYGPLTGGNQYYIFARRYNSSGQALDSQEFRLTSATVVNQEYPCIGMDDQGNFIIAWTNKSPTSAFEVYGRRYDSTGQPQGNEFLSGPMYSSSSSNASPAQVAMGSDRDFALVWESSGDIQLRRYSAAGLLLDASPIVVASKAGDGLNPDDPSVGKDGSGNIIVTWHQLISFAPIDHNVFVRRFSAAGEPLDGPTLIHDFITGEQLRPDIAADSLGGYVATWESADQDGNGPGIFYRTFGDRPDILLSSAITNGATGFTINYTIAAKVDGFNVSIYRSADGAVNSGDALMTTVRISEPTDLTPGPHSKSFTIGNGNGQVPLPGAGAPEVDSDYQMLVAIDVLDQVREDDIDPLTEDNVKSLTGVYHLAGGSVFVLGSSASDSVRVSRGSVIVDIDGDIFTFPETDVTDVHVRAHEGDDEVVVDGHSVPLMAYGGEGQDHLIGGSGADHLFGGDGDDQIFGGAGNDMLDGGADDDLLQGQGGADQMFGQAGNDSLEGGVGADTMDGGEGDNQVVIFGDDNVVSTADTVINDAVPSIQIPSARFTVRSGSQLHFGGTDASRFAIVDPFPEGTLQVQLSVSRGTLNLPTLSGLILVNGTGTADASVTVSGGLDDLNAALNGLTFTAPTSAGTLELQVTLLETTGNGQPLDSESLSLTVLPSGQPVFDDATFQVAENRPTGSVLATLMATDPDTDQTLTYTILSGNTTNAFAIDEATGKLRVANGGKLDFETTASFTLIVQATDSGTPALFDTATIKIDVLDVNDPPDARDDVFSLGTTSEAVPLTVLANDVTTPDVGETLTIIAVSQPANGSVIISEGKTVIYTPGVQLDSTDSFTYTVSDGRGGFDIASVSFTSNQRPADIVLSNASVRENVTGLTIGTLSVSEQDAGQSHTLASSDARFEIVGTTLKLKSDQFLDMTQGATVSVDVTATDSGTPPQSLTKTFVLQLVANSAAWKNPANPLDTNADGTVVPLDALRIINQLNAPTLLETGNRLPKARPAESSLVYYDVNGDGFCTSNDVLRVVNFLNGGGSEGEATTSLGEVSETTEQGFVVPAVMPTHSYFGPAPEAKSTNRRSSHTIAPLVGPERANFAPGRMTRPTRPAEQESDRFDRLLDELAKDVASAGRREG